MTITDAMVQAEFERVFNPANLPVWVHRLAEPDRGDVIDRASRDLGFRCHCFDAWENEPMQRRLVSETRRLMCEKA